MTTLRPHVAHVVAKRSPSAALRLVVPCGDAAMTWNAASRWRMSGGRSTTSASSRVSGVDSKDAARRCRSSAARATQPPRPNRSTTTSPARLCASIRAPITSGDGGGASRSNAGSAKPGVPWRRRSRPAIAGGFCQRDRTSPPARRVTTLLRDARAGEVPSPDRRLERFRGRHDGGRADRAGRRAAHRRPDTAPARPTDARLWENVRAPSAQAVVGAEDALRLILVALLAEGHALIEDVPGVGKTLLARATARALGLDTARIQGTPDLLPGDVTGASILEDGHFRFVPGPVFTNILLIDEINRATPRTQSALLEAMQERQVSVEGETRPLPEPFVVLATQNPIEYEGTFALARSAAGPVPRPDRDRVSRRGLPNGASRAATRPTRSPSRSCRRVMEAADAARRSRASSADSTSATRSRPTRSRSSRRRGPSADLQLGGKPAGVGRAVPRGAGVGVPRRPRVRAARTTCARSPTRCSPIASCSTSIGRCAAPSVQAVVETVLAEVRRPRR